MDSLSSSGGDELPCWRQKNTSPQKLFSDDLSLCRGKYYIIRKRGRQGDTVGRKEEGKGRRAIFEERKRGHGKRLDDIYSSKGKKSRTQPTCRQKQGRQFPLSLREKEGNRDSFL